MKDLIQNLKFRKVMLAISDAFIVAMAALIVNFFGGGPRGYLAIGIVTSVVLCFVFLFIFGAYNKLWRHFNAKDYISCVAGVCGECIIKCVS